PINGQWVAENGAYVQRETGKFDLISFYRNPIAGDVTFGADVTYLDGDMGGGLVFLAPTRERKAGAQMISFTADGSYLQWGWFDANGDFQFTGGVAVSPAVNDGLTHRLAVTISGDRYFVRLDGETVGSDIPLESPDQEGYVGLFVNTSSVAFDNVTVEAALT
ncbi:MAG: hypothetical protein ACR2J8_09670, partial [Thermomicrobiales bacterium]